MIYILYLYLVTSTLDQSLKDFFSPIVYLRFVLSTILLFDIVARKPWAIRFTRKNNKYLFLASILSFVLVCVASFLVNLGDPYSAVQFIVSVLNPFIIFIWVVTSKKYRKITKYTIRLLLALILLQVPFFVTNILRHGTNYFGDAAIGTGINGDAKELGRAFWMGALFFLFSAINEKKMKYFAYSLGCLLLLAITSNKEIFLILPLCIILTLAFFRRISFKASLALFVFFAVALVAYVYSQEHFMGRHNELDANYLTLLEASQKYEGYVQAFTRLPEEIPFPFLGAGPGQFSSFAAIRAQTPLAERFVISYAEMVPWGTRGTLTTRTSGVITFFGELGILGILIFYSIYFRNLKNIRDIFLVQGEEVDFTICALTFAIGIAIIVESLLFDIFETNLLMLNIFWVLSGTVVGSKVFARNGKRIFEGNAR